MYQAVIVGAGSGVRAGLPYRKIFYEINGKPLVTYSVEAFLRDKDCEGIVLVAHPEDIGTLKTLFAGRNVQVVAGGPDRQESVRLGLEAAVSPYVLIHDAARPYLPEDLLERIKAMVKVQGAAIPVVPEKDTLKRVEDGKIAGNVEREGVVHVQTPQAFSRETITLAHERARHSRHRYTDDSSLYMNELGRDVYVVAGDEKNIKGTTEIDFRILEETLC